jgi:hypothetical protein
VQGSEPPGTQAGEDEEHAAGSDHEPAPKPARRRRLMVMSDDEDDDDEPPQAKSPSEAEGEENDAAVGDPSRYVERMRVVDGGFCRACVPHCSVAWLAEKRSIDAGAAALRVRSGRCHTKRGEVSRCRVGLRGGQGQRKIWVFER